MRLCDFGRSYVTWWSRRGPQPNTARIQIDARCSLGEDGGGCREDFVLITPCKAERMYLADNLFQVPNYDYCGVWSSDDYMVLRTPLVHAQPGSAIQEIEIGRNAERFEKVRIDLAWHESAEPLADGQAIVQATLANRPIAATTTLTDPKSGLRVILEYPVKTMNVQPETNRFQVDTGPVLLPDFEAKASRSIERLVMAFVCYNTFDRAEFVIRRPTPVQIAGREVCRVWHYSEIRVMPAEHRIFAVGG